MKVFQREIVPNRVSLKTLMVPGYPGSGGRDFSARGVIRQIKFGGRARRRATSYFRPIYRGSFPVFFSFFLRGAFPRRHSFPSQAFRRPQDVWLCEIDENSGARSTLGWGSMVSVIFKFFDFWSFF